MTIPRVLIIKHGSIGDIFMSLDAVKAIQKKYSDITLVSTNSGHRIFDDSDFNFKKISLITDKNIKQVAILCWPSTN